MGNFLTTATGTKSQVGVQNTNPYAALNQTMPSQNQLIGTLQGEAAGGGPNPAQAQYLQNAQGIAQQQANTFAQNRALNPGLAARLASNQAASVGQQAASTAGIQQAQEQLASESLLGNTIAQQQSALNNAGAINAQIASGNQQAAEGLAGGAISGGGSFLSLADGGSVEEPTISAGGGGAGTNFKEGGGGGGGAAGLLALLAQGGVVGHEGLVGGYADGGVMNSNGIGYTPIMTGPMSSGIASIGETPVSVGSGPAASFGSIDLSGGKKGQGKSSEGDASADTAENGAMAQGAEDTVAGLGYAKGGKVLEPHLEAMKSIYSKVPRPHPEPKINQVPQKDRFYAKGGPVKAMVSPGEGYLPPSDAKAVAEGKESATKNAQKFPGHAQVKGDSKKNDTVPVTLEEGGIVIPRSVLASPNPEEEAKKFVAKALAKHKKTPEGEFHAALRRAATERKSK